LGTDVTVVCTNATQTSVVNVARERREEDVKIVTCPIWAGGYCRQANRFGVSIQFCMEATRRVREADIVHLNGFWGPGPALAMAACRARGKKYIVSTRANLEQRSLNDKSLKKGLALHLGGKQLLQNAATLHYTTNMERDLSPAWIRGIESVVVPNPVEMPPRVDGGSIRERFGVEKSALLLGAFGRLHQRKGFDVLLPALARSARTDVRLLAVGHDEAGYQKELERTVEREGLGNRVVFTGELSGEDLARAYAAIDLLVLPSHGESFGNVIVEAAAQGTPCMISDQVGLKNWVAENDIGSVFPLDIDTWAAAIIKLSKTEILCRWEPERLAQLARGSFSIEAVARQMLECYERILSS
jgi:glycosyltransferase involved in cell wall biosynthesis